jgi:hypothetical protein
MGEDMSEESKKPNKAAEIFAKLGSAKIRNPDVSGPWQCDGFACDDLHQSAVFGEQEEADQACDSVFIADNAIMKMMSS